MKFRLPCMRCSEPADFLFVDHMRARSALREFEDARAAVPRSEIAGLRVVCLADLPMLHTERWHLCCRGCMTQDELTRNDYWYGCERMKTWPTFLQCIAHISTKGWIDGTDFDRLLRYVAAANTAREPLSKRRRFKILRRDEFTCQYCGRKAPQVVLHVDHVVPKARGGSDADDNLVAACSDCNLGKAARPL